MTSPPSGPPPDEPADDAAPQDIPPAYQEDIAPQVDPPLDYPPQSPAGPTPPSPGYFPGDLRQPPGCLPPRGDHQQPYGYPPGYAPPPAGYPPPPAGYPYGGPPKPEPRISIAMVILGPFIYAGINFVIALMAIMTAGSRVEPNQSNTVLGFGAVLLALIAFGGGAALLRSRNPNARGLGVGLMVGWALMSLFTAGFCTGINPELYK